MRVLLIIALLNRIPTGSTVVQRKLSKAEDVELLKRCGVRDASETRPPWMTRIRYLDSNTVGMVISNRHAIIHASDLMAKYPCKESDLKKLRKTLESFMKDKVTIAPKECWAPDAAGCELVHPSRMWYDGKCSKTNEKFTGYILYELEENKTFEQKPICLPRNHSDVSFDWDTRPKIKMSRYPGVVEDLNYDFKEQEYERDPNDKKSPRTPNPSIRSSDMVSYEVNNRAFFIGFSPQEDDKSNGNGRLMMFGDQHFKHFCNFAGICYRPSIVTSTEPPTTTTNTSETTAAATTSASETTTTSTIPTVTSPDDKTTPSGKEPFEYDDDDYIKWPDPNARKKRAARIIVPIETAIVHLIALWWWWL